MIYLLMMMTGLAAAAAGAMRLSLPLLVLVILAQGWGFCPESPVLEWLCQPVTLVPLVFWTLFEVVGSRTALGQRVVQAVQFIGAPLMGALLVSVVLPEASWLQLLTGSCLAAVLQLVQTGYIFRKGFLPWWFTLAQDGLAVGLVLMALGAPWLGGMVALGLVGLALYQTRQWQQFNPACGKY
ncbi:DUF4126 domain-containing protein [Candidatus Cyanaurora vandensis]|uniref:DUF4126 domain-containing protein n=1 Tax=Candidatus Cyanaurora vandensis TaxID=2714958 RepID=UPI00257EB871|nr:DUF4126 domain-containing protein [Candidatus Cyanaurora vandensis]